MNRFIYATLFFASPAIAFAQEPIGVTLRNILNFIGEVVSFLGPLLIGVALLAFFWSLINFLFRREEAPNSGKYLSYSVLILFIMVSIWGIIAFLQTNLGIRNQSAEGATQGNINRLIPQPGTLD